MIRFNRIVPLRSALTKGASTSNGSPSAGEEKSVDSTQHERSAPKKPAAHTPAAPVASTDPTLRNWTERGVHLEDAHVLAADPEVAEFVEESTRAELDLLETTKLAVHELRRLRKHHPDIYRYFTPERVRELFQVVENLRLSTQGQRSLIAAIAVERRTAAEVVSALDLAQPVDREALGAAVAAALEEHPDEVAKFRSGRRSVLGFLVGTVVKKGGGRFDPAQVRELLEAALGPSDA